MFLWTWNAPLVREGCYRKGYCWCIDLVLSGKSTSWFSHDVYTVWVRERKRWWTDGRTTGGDTGERIWVFRVFRCISWGGWPWYWSFISIIIYSWKCSSSWHYIIPNKFHILLTSMTTIGSLHQELNGFLASSDHWPFISWRRPPMVVET